MLLPAVAVAGLVAEDDTGLLAFAVGQEPDEAFVMQVGDLDAVAEGVAEIAAEAGDEGQAVELVSKFRWLMAQLHPEDMGVEGNGCRGVGNLDGDMVARVGLDRHEVS